MMAVDKVSRSEALTIKQQDGDKSDSSLDEDEDEDDDDEDEETSVEDMMKLMT